MTFFTTWNIALVYIMGAEIIHFLQVKYLPELLQMDANSDKWEEKYSGTDLFPFLLLELFYIIAIVYLLFAPHFALTLFSGIMIFLGILKMIFMRHIQNRIAYIRMDAIATMLFALIIFIIVNTDYIF